MIVWALFDSGNGCYTSAFKQWARVKPTDYNIIPIGIDIAGRKGDFIELDLASYTDLFGDKSMWNTLDELPKPDLIIASPPCESWSVASAMTNGNASWKKGSSHTGETSFIPRMRKEYSGLTKNGKVVQFKFKRSFLQRINGELTIYNTLRIISRYKPKVFIIENPQLSRIWKYIDEMLGVNIPYHNVTYYSSWGYEIHKPTIFASNIDLKLRKEKGKKAKSWNEFSKDYNIRSNIPLSLIEHIFTEVEQWVVD